MTEENRKVSLQTNLDTVSHLYKCAYRLKKWTQQDLIFSISQKESFPTKAFALKKRKDGAWVICLESQGLWGAQSLLPHFMNEQAYREGEENAQYRQFINFLHQKLYQHLFELFCLQQERLFSNREAYLQELYCLSYFSSQLKLPVPPFLSAHLNTSSPSLLQLERALSQALKRQVRFKAIKADYVDLPEQPAAERRLGKQLYLGWRWLKPRTVVQIQVPCDDLKSLFELKQNASQCFFPKVSWISHYFPQAKVEWYLETRDKPYPVRLACQQTRLNQGVVLSATTHVRHKQPFVVQLRQNEMN